MSYTLKELELAVRNTLVIGKEETRDCVTPEALKETAVELFLNDQCDCPDALIVREALLDLKQKGFLASISSEK